LAYRAFPDPKKTPLDPPRAAFGRRNDVRRAKRARRTKWIRTIEVAALALGLGGLAIYLSGVV
jgi:hypothetical protein